jgi:hypothetical protein
MGMAWSCREVARSHSGPVLTPPKQPRLRMFQAQESHLCVSPLSHMCSPWSTASEFLGLVGWGSWADLSPSVTIVPPSGRNLCPQLQVAHAPNRDSVVACGNGFPTCY